MNLAWASHKKNYECSMKSLKFWRNIDNAKSRWTFDDILNYFWGTLRYLGIHVRIMGVFRKNVGKMLDFLNETADLEWRKKCYELDGTRNWMELEIGWKGMKMKDMEKAP